MNDILYLAAKSYDDYLNNRDFNLRAGNKKRQTIDVDIIFRSEHFKHLIGIHKLTDIPESKIPSNILLSEVLKKRITNNDLLKSEYYHVMVERINYFNEIRNTLFEKEIMLGKINEQSFKTIKADFLMTKNYDFGITELFLKNKAEGIAIPCTFFSDIKNNYLDNTERWTVLDIKEISLNINSKKVYSEKEVLLKNKAIRYGEEKPESLINSSFVLNGEEYNILDINLVSGQTKDIAILKRVRDNTIFIDKDFASQAPLTLHLEQQKETINTKNLKPEKVKVAK